MESVSRGEEDAASHDEDEEFEEESDFSADSDLWLFLVLFVIPTMCTYTVL